MGHDFYHLPGYVDFAAMQQVEGEAIAFVAEREGHRLLLPLIVRDVPAKLGGDGQLRDGISPRGYPGPLLHLVDGRPDAGFLDNALDAVTEVMRSMALTSVFIRLHPLLTPPTEPLARRGALVDHGDSVSIDLTLPADELWRQTRKNHRRDIIDAARGGHVARIDEDWERFDEFVAAFRQSMARRAAAPRWQLGREYLLGLRQALGGRLHLCLVEDESQTIAAALLTEVGGIVEYHLAGTFDAFVKASPSKTAIHFARQWAKDRGNHDFHLAGSLRRGDSLMRFKTGFGGRIRPVHSWRLIVDPLAYARLKAAWSDRHRKAPDRPDGFFPAYRKVEPEGLSRG